MNARPQTKAEKRQTRTAIRSHIGKWTQEKQQKVDVNIGSASEKELPSESSRTVPLSPALTEQSQPPPRNRIGSAWPETVDGASDSHSNLESLEDDVNEVASERGLVVPAQLRRQRAEPSGEPTFFVQAFGSGILDPFRTYPSNFPSSLVSQAHDYCEKALPPHFR